MTPIELDRPISPRAAYDEEYWPPPTHPLLLTAALVVLAAASVVATTWFARSAGMGDGPSADATVEVPALVGMSQRLATTVAMRHDLTVDVEQVRNVAVPAGMVFRQDPGSGALVSEGDPVQLVVSAGDGFTVVPQVVGSRSSDLASQLYAFGLGVGEVTEREDWAAAGEVLEQDPAPGTEVALGAGVEVVVSTGPPPVQVPDVSRLTRVEAVQILTQAGFRVSIRQWYSSARPGTAVSTDPRRGTEAPHGSPIRVYVSRGPAPVTTTVPDPADVSPPVSVPPASAPPVTAPPPPSPPAPTGPGVPAPPPP